MSKILDYLATIIIILGISYLYFSLVYLSWENFYYPAYLSVLSDCKVITEKQINNAGYQIAGQFIYSNTNQSYYDVEIYIPDKKIVKHEMCHKWQFDKGFRFSCDNKVVLYFAELQCYLAEYF